MSSLFARVVSLAVCFWCVAADQSVLAQDSTYEVTPGYDRVQAAVARLQREGDKLSPSASAILLRKGQAIIDLEQTYFREEFPSQKWNMNLTARIKAFEAKPPPERTQEEENQLNIESAKLNSIIDQENAALIDRYAAFAESVSAAFAASPPPRDPTHVPIDRIDVPSPEIIAKSYIQLDLQPWSDDAKAVIIASNKVLRKIQDAVDETVTEVAVNELKNRALKPFEYIPGYETVKSLKEQLETMKEAYAKPTLNLVQPLFDDIQVSVWELRDPDAYGSFAADQRERTRIRHETAQRAYNDATGHKLLEHPSDAIKNVFHMENTWIEKNSGFVTNEAKVTLPDTSRWLP